MRSLSAGFAALLLVHAHGCLPPPPGSDPQGGSPSTGCGTAAPAAQPGTASDAASAAQQGAPAAPTPAPSSLEELGPLPMPQTLPAEVYTRTAPASLVDERGAPLQVLTGHHTLLELRHVLGERALVACRHCPTPVEGWIQTRRLMPADHAPTPAEQSDEQLELASYVVGLRVALERDGVFPDLDPSAVQRETLLRIMDQGFVREEREAMAPASGGAYAREGASIRLRRGPDGWRVKQVEFSRPSTP